MALPTSAPAWLLPQAAEGPGGEPASEETLWRRVLNSLVAEYLSSANYVFSLSVFQASAPRGST